VALRDVHDLAAEQAGCFTTAQALERAGWGPQHLSYHVGQGNIDRIRRGVYRLTRYPRADDEELIVVWLWSEQHAVFSHQTALVLHGLSDLTMSRFHVIVPSEWTHRRLRWPDRVTPHYADLEDEDVTWIGNVPVTSAARAVADCADEALRPDELQKAIAQGLARGLFEADHVAAPQARITAWLNRDG
jgi:predicted transcriptional regulator of viral defense system